MGCGHKIVLRGMSYGGHVLREGIPLEDMSYGWTCLTGGHVLLEACFKGGHVLE